MSQRLPILLFLLAMACQAQLTIDQKIAEFEQMAGMFAKGYGPHDWKKQAFGIDLYDNAKWYQQIRATRTDIEFFDVMARWVAQLNDAHDTYSNPSNFVAQLNFWVDLYDGKLLVDFVDRGRLPASQFPITNGYELVSIDGVEATKILEEMLSYNAVANPKTSQRFAAEAITYRWQGVVPKANMTPEISTVVFRRFDGGLESYRIPWTKTGVPLESVGVYPGYRSGASREVEPDLRETTPEFDVNHSNLVDRYLRFRLPQGRMVLNFGSTTPIFARSLPGNFIIRLGRSSADPFYSGTFESSGNRIGFIRIPTFSPSDFTGALTLFAREIAFFQQNTDGLIVDVMRNGGGSSSYTDALLGYLMFYRWRTMGLEIRATSTWIASLSATVESLRAQNAPPSLIAGFEDTLGALKDANRTNRGLTRPVPWDFGAGLEREPLRVPDGSLVAYTKPMLLLTDELSASAADGFAAIIQDNGRALLFGWRTMGAGGNVTSRMAGAYSGSSVSLTESLMSRAMERSEPGGYPPTRYVENVGVHPDYLVDYMTAENLFQNGRPYVNAFIAAMNDHIARSRQ